MATVVSPRTAAATRAPLSITGRSARRFGLHGLAQLVSVAVVALTLYSVGMVAAGWVMPRLMAGVATAMGIDLASATLAGFGVWLVSSGVLGLLVTATVIWFARAMWSWRGRLMARLGERLERN